MSLGEDEGVERVPPRADSMMESLRAVGYTLEAAVADLVDNSVTAGSRHIVVEFRWNGSDSTIMVADDGRGMDEPTLVEAMRPAGRNPQSERPRGDLGRFGLGLKTASLSQGRLLTVVSRVARHPPHGRYWDLDLLKGQGEWLLRKGSPECARPFVDRFVNPGHGTIVIWQKLDRLLNPRAGFGDEVRDHFLLRGVAVKKHLAMVFHRFLEGPNALSITVNEDAVKPWDPFLRVHPKTQWLEKEAYQIFGKSLEVRPYVLPYHSNLTPEQHSDAGGVAGWNAMQGFYVYRGRRLLVAGGYLDLKLQQEPHYSLARIQLDLPNSMDSDWQLDVKKATAIPPASLRRSLEKIAGITRRQAAAVYRHRGRIVRREHAGNEELVWQLRKKQGKKFFMINRQHPVIHDAISGGGDTALKIRRVLSVIERSLPLESMAFLVHETPEEFATGAEQADDEEIVTQGLALYKMFCEEGMSPEAAKTRLLLIEPFGDSAPLVARIDELREGAGL